MGMPLPDPQAATLSSLVDQDNVSKFTIHPIDLSNLVGQTWKVELVYKILPVARILWLKKKLSDCLMRHSRIIKNEFQVQAFNWTELN